MTPAEAKQALAPIKIAIPDAGNPFPGLGTANSAMATFDDRVNLRIVEVPDKEHPKTHSIRLITPEMEGGQKHAVALLYRNDTREVEAIYANMEGGKPDSIAMALAGRQDARLPHAHNSSPALAGLNFHSEPNIVAFSAVQHAWIKSINQSLDQMPAMATQAAATSPSMEPEPTSPKPATILPNKFTPNC
ncbi:MAG: hypothetical protein AB7H77_06480 [Bdellovibrionales bacterium]